MIDHNNQFQLTIQSSPDVSNPISSVGSCCRAAESVLVVGIGPFSFVAGRDSPVIASSICSNRLLIHFGVQNIGRIATTTSRTMNSLSPQVNGVRPGRMHLLGSGRLLIGSPLESVSTPFVLLLFCLSCFFNNCAFCFLVCCNLCALVVFEFRLSRKSKRSCSLSIADKVERSVLDEISDITQYYLILVELRLTTSIQTS